MYTFGQRSDFGSRAVSGRHMLGSSVTSLDKLGQMVRIRLDLAVMVAGCGW